MVQLYNRLRFVRFYVTSTDKVPCLLIAFFVCCTDHSIYLAANRKLLGAHQFRYSMLYVYERCYIHYVSALCINAYVTQTHTINVFLEHINVFDESSFFSTLIALYTLPMKQFNKSKNIRNIKN